MEHVQNTNYAVCRNNMFTAYGKKCCVMLHRPLLVVLLFLLR